MRIAVYAGSFDPPTLGHMDVIQRVAKRFDKLIVVIAENPRKAGLFNSQERKTLIEDSMDKGPKSVRVEIHNGLISDFCKKVGAETLVRGLRAISDFDGEFAMATMNRKLNANLETIFVVTDEKYLFLSSSLVKEVAINNGNLKGLVSEKVSRALKKKFKQIGAK